MNCWEARSANEILVKLVARALEQRGETQPSRLGPVLDLGPSMIRLSKGSPRLVDLPARALNPIFAMVEACWILVGRNDLAPLVRHVKRMRLFSDDGIILNGAYGYRIQHAFGLNQLSRAIDALRRDPESRRIVLSLYHPDDLGSQSKDVPCNTSVMFRVIRNDLSITVINRSNDIIFGLPYNLFCFALIQQFVADALGISTGEQIHFSNSMHLYTKNVDIADRILQNAEIAIVQPAPDMVAFLRQLLREAEAIGSGEFSNVRDSALSNFLDQSGKFGGTGLRDGDERIDIVWLNEMYNNWSQSIHVSTVATPE